MHKFVVRAAVSAVTAVLALGVMGNAAQAAPAPVKPIKSAVGGVHAAADLSYNYDYSTGMGWPQTQLQTPESVMSEVGTNFWRYFPFSSDDCTSIPAVGGVCHLNYLGTVNPVQVVDRTATSFTFLSLPGHSEGEGRYVRFTFYKAGVAPLEDIRLYAQGWGPWTLPAYLTINSGQVNGFWGQFASNVGNAYR